MTEEKRVELLDPNGNPYVTLEERITNVEAVVGLTVAKLEEVLRNYRNEIIGTQNFVGEMAKVGTKKQQKLLQRIQRQVQSGNSPKDIPDSPNLRVLPSTCPDGVSDNVVQAPQSVSESGHTGAGEAPGGAAS